ncbi:DUF645 family protein [Vibrio tarriae]|uniref:DUF645 family protein n=1 Tax=Vibrio tarriae TaxID=2014742 RepID=UPI00215CF2F4|nr:DUF645 family protein [Vibrio tarriae]
MLSDVQNGQFGFPNSCITAEIVLSLSRTFNRGQLNLDRFKYWLPLHRFWRWTCACSKHLHKMTFKQMC